MKRVVKIISLILLFGLAVITTSGRAADTQNPAETSAETGSLVKENAKFYNFCPMCMRPMEIRVYNPASVIALRDQLHIEDEQLSKIKTIATNADLNNDQNRLLSQIADPPVSSDTDSQTQQSSDKKSNRKDRFEKTNSFRDRIRDRYMDSGYRTRDRYSYRFRDRGWDDYYTWPGDLIHGYHWFYRPGLGWYYSRRPPYTWGYGYYYYPYYDYFPYRYRYYYPRNYERYRYRDYYDYHNDYDSTDMYDDFDYRFEREGLQGGGIRQGLDRNNDYGNFYRDYDY